MKNMNEKYSSTIFKSLEKLQTSDPYLTKIYPKVAIV